MIESRPYESAADLRRMQRLVQDVWAVRRRKSAHHVGDLAWQRFQHVGREPDWRTQLWQDDEKVVAYGWVREEDVLDFCVHPGRPELLDEVIEWADARATEVLDSDLDSIATLERHGFARAPAGAPFFALMARELAELRHAAAPDGFVLRTVEAADVESRVTAHRSAFDPSRVTVESYRNVMSAWPYRADLDCVAVAPDGRVAAYCLAWLDEENRVGEFEPVGAHADFRRLGLASAVCTFALRRLREEGASLAVVYSRGDAADPTARRMYESLGFRAHARTMTFSRPD